MTEYQRIRRNAGITQIAVAVRANVAPMTVRNFERFGSKGVEDPAKLARLEAVYAVLSTVRPKAA